MGFTALLQHATPSYKERSSHFQFKWYGNEMTFLRYKDLQQNWKQTTYFLNIRKEDM